MGSSTKQQAMITIPKKTAITASGSLCTEPDRLLTDDERDTTTETWGDENNYWYFQPGDETTPEWAEYQAHITQPPQETPGRLMQIFQQSSTEEKKELAAELKQLMNL
jgi:hypothetical protein